MKGNTPPQWFYGNGCTGVPDWMFNCDLREACRYHDWCYFMGNTPRWEADWNLYYNLMKLGLPETYALIYWLGVRVIGWLFYKRRRQ